MNTHEMPSAERKQQSGKKRLLEVIKNLNTDFGEVATVGEFKKIINSFYEQDRDEMRQSASSSARNLHAFQNTDRTGHLREAKADMDRAKHSQRIALEEDEALMLMRSYATDDNESFSSFLERLRSEN